MSTRGEPTRLSASPHQERSTARRGPLAALAVAVAGLTFLAFVPVLGNEFVSWDDDTLILNNPDFRGFELRHLRWMFSTMILGNYQPVTWLSFALDYTIWGLRPFGYHLTNLILHSLGAALFFFIARRMLRASCPLARGPAIDLAAAAAALLYSVHPLRVESVAWAVERKDVLSGFFLFACLLAYLRGIEAAARPVRRGWIVLSLVLFVLSLLSKVWGITFPLVLLILDTYPLKRFNPGERRARLVEKLPFIFLAGAAALTALYAQTNYATSVARLDVAGRFAQSAFGIVFYFAKMLLPLRLSPIYEHPLPFNPIASQDRKSVV